MRVKTRVSQPTPIRVYKAGVSVKTRGILSKGWRISSGKKEAGDGGTPSKPLPVAEGGTD